MLDSVLVLTWDQLLMLGGRTVQVADICAASPTTQPSQRADGASQPELHAEGGQLIGAARVAQRAASEQAAIPRAVQSAQVSAAAAPAREGQRRMLSLSMGVTCPFWAKQEVLSSSM